MSVDNGLIYKWLPGDYRVCFWLQVPWSCSVLTFRTNMNSSVQKMTRQREGYKQLISYDGSKRDPKHTSLMGLLEPTTLYWILGLKS